MAISPEQYEEIVMNIIVEAGNARSLAMEAIQKAKAGDLAGAEETLKTADEALIGVHESQTQLIQAELQGDHVQVMLLMVHAQDHLMDAIVVKDMAAEFVDLYKKINS